MIRILEIELEKKEEEAKNDYRQNIVKISKYLGYRVDGKKITVVDYNSAINEMIASVK